jgi:chlorobactene glucosyltransferase
MTLEVLAYIAFGFLFIRILVAAINMLSDVVLERRGGGESPFISILIPARNEEETLPQLIVGLSALDYIEYEVIVYDDASEDRTPQILEEQSRKFAWLNYVRGEGPEDGWLGKTYACHELSKLAKGDYLLFLDADVTIETSLLRDAITTAVNSGVKLLSVFPRQIMSSAGEWFTVPVMNQILVSLLPLYLVRHSSWKDFTAANGQFMLFEASNYHRHKYHQAFKADPVEDINIMKAMKKQGADVMTNLSAGQLSCRMYQNYKQAVRGFSKNVIEFFGGRILLILLYLFLTNFGILFVWMSLPSISLFVYLSMIVLLKILTSATSRQEIILNILLQPIQQASFNVIVFSAIYSRMVNKLEWKGRRVKLRS